MNREEVLSKLAAGEIRVEEAANLMKQAEPAKGGSLYCRVSEKGAVSVYGLQRMPVTLDVPGFAVTEWLTTRWYLGSQVWH